MELIWRGLLEAIHLIVSGDPGVFQITGLSLQISGGATLLSLLAGIPVPEAGAGRPLGLGADLAAAVVPFRSVDRRVKALADSVS